MDLERDIAETRTDLLSIVTRVGNATTEPLILTKQMVIVCKILSIIFNIGQDEKRYLLLIYSLWR